MNELFQFFSCPAGLQAKLGTSRDRCRVWGIRERCRGCLAPCQTQQAWPGGLWLCWDIAAVLLKNNSKHSICVENADSVGQEDIWRLCFCDRTWRYSFRFHWTWRGHWRGCMGICASIGCFGKVKCPWRQVYDYGRNVYIEKEANGIKVLFWNHHHPNYVVDLHCMQRAI